MSGEAESFFNDSSTSFKSLNRATSDLEGVLSECALSDAPERKANRGALCQGDGQDGGKILQHSTQARDKFTFDASKEVQARKLVFPQCES